MDKKIQRLILKEEDVLVVKVPLEWFTNRVSLHSFYREIKKKLLPRKNKILMIPEEMGLSVIGKREIKEHISNVDLWSLWDEDGEETTQENIEE